MVTDVPSTVAEIGPLGVTSSSSVHASRAAMWAAAMREPFPENSASDPSGFRIRTFRPETTRMPSDPAPRSGWQMRATRAGVSSTGASAASMTR